MNRQAPDYLKYWRVISRYTKLRYKLTAQDLDMLLFLYSEKNFNMEKYREFANILSWDRGRFKRLVDNGWIEKVHIGLEWAGKDVYRLTEKATKMIKHLYNKLDGTEITTTGKSNPMFYKKVRFTDKVYRMMIVKMNKVARDNRSWLKGGADPEGLDYE